MLLNARTTKKALLAVVIFLNYQNKLKLISWKKFSSQNHDFEKTLHQQTKKKQPCIKYGSQNLAINISSLAVHNVGL